MELVYANEPLPVRQIKSIFLAGPSPRRLAVEDWRHRAVHLLDKVGYDGHLFVPCPRDVFEGAEVESPWSFDGQVAWEVAARQQSDVICYWMARRIDRGWVDLGLPGFTSNFQLGEDLATGRVAYGRPPGSEKNTYLDARMRERGMPVHEQLEALLAEALDRLGDGSPREGDDVKIGVEGWRQRGAGSA